MVIAPFLSSFYRPTAPERNGRGLEYALAYALAYALVYELEHALASALACALAEDA